MLKYHEAMPSPISTTSASLEASTFQSYEPTAELQFTTEIQNVELEASPTRRKSIRPQIRSESLVARSTEAISNGAAKAKHLSDHVTFDAQTNTHVCVGYGAACQVLLPARRRVSLLASERHLNNSTAFPSQGNSVNQHDDKHTRKNRRRRTIWVPSDDTTILTIHPGIQSDANSLLKVINQSDAGNRGRRKPLAAAPKRAALQPALKHIQESKDHHGSYVPM